MEGDIGRPTFGDGRYYDQLSISVQLVPYIGEPATDVLDLELLGSVVDAAAARDLLEASVNVDGWVSHDIEMREHRHSWGASGATGQIVMLVSQGVIGNAAYEALKAALRKISDEARQRTTRLLQPNDLTADEATARAIWLVEQRFGIAAQNLSVSRIAETLEPRTFDVELENDGVHYEVTVEESDGLALFSRIAMSQSA